MAFAARCAQPSWRAAASNQPALAGGRYARKTRTDGERDHPGHNGPRAALRAIQRWCYNPATAAGCPLGARRWPWKIDVCRLHAAV